MRMIEPGAETFRNIFSSTMFLVIFTMINFQQLMISQSTMTVTNNGT